MIITFDNIHYLDLLRGTAFWKMDVCTMWSKRKGSYSTAPIRKIIHQQLMSKMTVIVIVTYYHQKPSDIYKFHLKNFLTHWILTYCWLTSFPKCYQLHCPNSHSMSSRHSEAHMHIMLVFHLIINQRMHFVNNTEHINFETRRGKWTMRWQD
jgi:hypothetical protein